MPSPDRLRPSPFITGLAGGLTVALIGAWLAVAPFAAGYQPDGADWVDATRVAVATGGLLIALGVAAATVIGLALRDEMRRRGLAPEPSAPEERDDPDELDDAWPQAPADPAELQQLLAPLATALLEDLRNGHERQASDEGAPDPGTSPTPDRSA